MTVTRREFCSKTGALLLLFAVPVEFRAAKAEAAKLSPSLADNPLLSSWIRLAKDGSVSAYPGKCEFGQGISTALAQIVAEELDVALERVRVEPVDTATSPDEFYTLGSLSIERSGSALRQAATEMRDLLLQNAARDLHVSADRLTVDDGRILLDGAASGTSYQGLLAGVDFDVNVSGTIVPKSPQAYRYVGRSAARLDLPGKVFAEPMYIQDVRREGMLHARIVRAPMQKQVLISVDEAAGKSMPGVEAVVRNGSFLAVVAGREEQAIAAAARLREAALWKSADIRPAENELPLVLRRMASEDSAVHRTTDTAAAIERTLSADYSRPFLAHASMSPSAAIAHWDEEALTVWSHGQGMFPLRGAIAAVVGLPEARVQLVHREASGCYGHNGADDAACDAAMIAMQLPGKHIRLQWSRQDEFRYEPIGGAMSMRVSAGLDEQGKVSEWYYDVWSTTHSGRPAGAKAAGNLHAAREKQNPLLPPPPRNLPQPVGGGDRNALPLYKFPNQLITKHMVLDSPRAVSALRGLGAYGNVFAIESFIDELALATARDPLDLRLEYLQDERAQAVLESLRDALATVPAGREGFLVGRGLGFARYKNLAAYAGVVCEVVVNQATGEVRVPLAFAAIDAGLVVNPDGLRNQTEGGIVQSTSWTLKEALHYGDAGTQSESWASYPILRFSEVPQVSVNVIDRPDKRSLGAGEAVQGPTAAAIANAVAAASGVRLRDLPLRPDRVLAALRSPDRSSQMPGYSKPNS